MDKLKPQPDALLADFFSHAAAFVFGRLHQARLQPLERFNLVRDRLSNA